MRKFKEGAFVLAKRQQRPILPIVISGSRTAVPKNSLNFHGNTHIDVTVLPPVEAETFEEQTASDLAARVQTMIAVELDPA